MTYTTQSDAYARDTIHETLRDAIERIHTLRAVTGAAIRRQSDGVAVAGVVQSATRRGAVFYALRTSRHATSEERAILLASAWVVWT